MKETLNQRNFAIPTIANEVLAVLIQAGRRRPMRPTWRAELRPAKPGPARDWMAATATARKELGAYVFLCICSAVALALALGASAWLRQPFAWGLN